MVYFQLFCFATGQEGSFIRSFGTGQGAVAGVVLQNTKLDFAEPGIGFDPFISVLTRGQTRFPEHKHKEHSTLNVSTCMRQIRKF